jgi:hypothetical protein
MTGYHRNDSKESALELEFSYVFRRRNDELLTCLGWSESFHTHPCQLCQSTSSNFLFLAHDSKIYLKEVSLFADCFPE